jgi:hypothetical protein
VVVEYNLYLEVLVEMKDFHVLVFHLNKQNEIQDSKNKKKQRKTYSQKELMMKICLMLDSLFLQQYHCELH